MSTGTGHGLDTSKEPALRVMMLPKDTNGFGTIFGGVILSYLDLAGSVEARRHRNAKFVTVAIQKVEFREPVFVGDIVSFYTETRRIGESSITVGVRVEAIRSGTEHPTERVHVTEAEIVYVAVDDDRRKVRVREA